MNKLSKLFLAAFLLMLPVLANAQVNLNVTVGTGGDYPTLSAFAAAVNTLGLGGNTTADIISNLVETEAVVINQWPESGGSGYYLTIQPFGESRTIEADLSANAVIVLNGADRVIINGELYEGERNLTITNTATSGTNAAIWIKSLGAAAGCENVTIKNTIIYGSNTASNVNTTFGIYSGGTTISTSGTGADNDYLTIENNQIMRATYGVYARGVATSLLNNLLITKNIIGGDLLSDYVRYRGVDIQHSDAPTITNNYIYNIRRTESALNIAGIEIGQNSANAMIANNIIHGVSQAVSTGYGAYGINISSATGNTDINVINNVIYDITTINYSVTSTTYNPFGIRITGGTGHKIWFNSINLFGPQTQSGTYYNGTLSACLMITATGVTALDVKNNVFSNSLEGLDGSNSYTVCAIGSATTFTSINNNDYFPSGLYGVLGHLGSPYSVTNNKITLADWQAATLQDANSISADPLFTSNTDLLPYDYSPLALAGEYIALVPLDILGNERNSPSTIGAYELESGGNMTYSASTVTHPITTPVFQGTDDQVIIRIEVVTQGIDNPIGVTNFSLNSYGTTSTNDVANAKLFYTGNSGIFSTANQFGSTVYNISPPFEITGFQSLNPGTNYFWLTYSISPTATLFDVVDAECISLTCDGIARIPEVTAPVGSRMIRSPMAGTFTVGTDGFYTDLIQAIEDINVLGLSGDVTLSIVSDMSLTSPAIISPWQEVGGTGYTLTIATTGDYIISGEFANGVIVLNGADRVIIDGSIDNEGNHLTIQNNFTTAASAAIRLMSLGENAGCENVTVKNCIVIGGIPTYTTAMGIYVAGTSITSSGTGQHNNYITITDNIVKRCYYGIYVSGASAGYCDNIIISNNSIGDEYPENYVSLKGIDISYVTNTQVVNNHIYNQRLTTGGSVIGIDMGAGCAGSIIANNLIHGLSQQNSSGYGAIGINISTATSNTDIAIVNNVIYDLTTRNYSATSTAYNPFGIRIVGGTGHKVWFNSINLYGTQPEGLGTAGTLSACLIVTGTGVTGLDIRNNVFSNSLVGLEGSNSYAICIIGSSATFSNINYNDYYVSGTYGVLGHIGSPYSTDNNKTTLEAWQGTSLQDLNSISTDPLFTAENDLLPTELSPLIFAGEYIELVPIDILGTERNSPPTIGAYEVVITGGMEYVSSEVALATPASVFSGDQDQAIIRIQVTTDGIDNPISVTSFTLNSNGTTNTSDVTNAKLFYTGSSTVFSTDNQFGSTVADVSTPFVIDGNQVLNPGNNYFWLTYSISATAAEFNVIDAECTALTCDGLSRVPNVTAPEGNRMIRDKMIGTYTVGEGGFYPNLNAAFTDIALLGLRGNLQLSIISDITEPAEAVLNQWEETGEGGYYVTIKPTGIYTIQGTIENGLIVISAANRVIIDGSIGEEGTQDLTIQNNYTEDASAAVRVLSLGAGEGCSDITIKNCNIIGGSPTETLSFGIFVGGTTLGTTAAGFDISNITIENNTVKRCYYGIFARGATANYIQNLLITKNEVGSDDPDYYIRLNGINIQMCDAPEVSHNHLFNIRVMDGTVTTYVAGIQIGSYCANALINANRVHGLRQQGTSTYGTTGILMSLTTGNDNLMIVNNVIYDILSRNYSATSTLYNPFGIRIAGGTNIKIWFNSVNLYGEQPPDTGTSGTLSACLMLTSSASTGFDVRNNVFSNSLVGLEGSTSYAVYSAAIAANFTLIDNNDYYVDGPYGVLGYINGTQHLSFEAWQSATLQDLNSMSLNPYFTSDEDLMPQDVTPLILAGVEIPLVQYDFLGVERYIIPTIGAYEVDASGLMTVNYTTCEQPTTDPVLLAQEDAAIIRVLIATEGIDNPLTVTNFDFSTLGTTNPETDLVNAKLFYTGPSQVFSAENQFGTTITDLDEIFSITGSLELLPGMNYFWLTYSISPTATIDNFVDAECSEITIESEDYTPLVPAPPGNRQIRAPFNGIYTVGTGGDYATLNDAFNAVGLLGLSGNTEFHIISDLELDSPADIYQWNEIGEGGYFLTVKPSDENRTISGNFNNGVININGADRFILDGRIEGLNGNYLTIINNNFETASAVVRLISLALGLGCEDVTIRNCNLIGGFTSYTTSFGIHVGTTALTTSSIGPNNDNLSILENNIQRCYYSILVRGNATEHNEGLYIARNTIGSENPDYYVGLRGVDLQNNAAPVIEGNHIFNLTLNSGVSITGVELGQNNAFALVSGNTIHTFKQTNSSGYGAYGVNISTATGNTDITIVNNVIFDLTTRNYSATSTTYNPFGIRIAGGSNHKIWFNSVNLFGLQPPDLGTTGTLSAAFLVSASAVTNLDVRNNVFSNSLEGLAGSNSYAIYSVASAPFATINYNDYYATGLYGVLGYLSEQRLSLAAWQTATGMDLQSIDLNPEFISNTDLNLLATSPLPTAGVYIDDVMFDILGNIRVNPPTIGAYELDITNQLPPPFLYTPANYSMGVALNPNFSWSLIENAESYILQVATDYTFENLVLDVSGILTTSYIPTTSLNPTYQYYWRVKGFATDMEAYWSQTWNFITEGPLDAPILIAPENGSTNLSPSTSLDWEPVFAASSYTLQVATNPEFTNLVINQSEITDSEFLPLGLSTLTTYYWRVQASNVSNTSPWSSIWTFSTGNIITIGTGTAYNTTSGFPAPYGNFYKSARHQILILASELLSNGGAAGLINSLSFSVYIPNNCAALQGFTIKMKHTTANVVTAWEYTDWATVFTATTAYQPVAGWNLHQFDEPFIWDGVSNLLIETCFSNYPASYTQNASHYYTVTPANSVVYYRSDTETNMCGTTSATVTVSANRPNMQFSFGSLIPPLDVPILTEPENQAIDVSINPDLHWLEVTDADTYQIQVSTASNFSTSVVDAFSSDNFYNVTVDLNYETTYYWRVKASNNEGASSQWSAVWSFTTAEEITVPWEVITETGNYATIIVPADINPMIGNRAFVAGDAIGLFYQRTPGEWHCAGFSIWNGNNLGINVCGDNIETTIKEGFAVGEVFTFRVWDAIAYVEYNATATYSLGPEEYQISGFTILSGLNVIVPQTMQINLNSGWNMISSNIIPEDALMTSVFNDITQNVNIVKNGAGQMFDPAFNINTIGDWNIAHGYFANMSANSLLEITGTPVIPQNTPINLIAGWNLSAYYRNSPMSPDIALASVGTTLTLCKNNTGGIFFPAFGLNTLGNMNVGEGYYMYLTDASTLTYPANSAQKALAGNLTPLAKQLKPKYTSTGNSATLILELNGIANGNEIGVYNLKDELIGAGAVHNGVSAVTIWGNDEFTPATDGAVDNEILNVKLLNNNTLQNISISDINELTNNTEQNEIYYKTNAIYLAKASINESELEMSIKNIPNPVTNSTIFEFSLTDEANAEIQIYNSTGELVAKVGNNVYSTGIHRISFDASNLSSGMYNIVLNAGEERTSCFMIVDK